MNLDVKGKKVLIRVDFNVPLDKDYNVTDDNRIQGALPTINYVLKNGGAAILMSHLGRPQKKKKEDGSINVEKFTLKHVANVLPKYIDATVKFCEETVGAKAEAMAADLQPGEVLVLENTRFSKGESKGDEDLAKGLASLADAYINDAFGTAHRAHASTTVVAKYFDKDSRSFGYLMNSEIESAANLMGEPNRPFTAIVGGAKVSDKILLLDKLIDSVDNLIIGGGMAYTFSKAMGGKIGDSICEDDKQELALQLMEKARTKGVKIFLPLDNKIADKFSNEANTDFVDTGSIPDGWQGLDIGPKSMEAFGTVVVNSKSILWNGPMGVFEFPSFANGTKKMAEYVAEATKGGAYSLIGGGDSVAAVTQMGLSDEVSHASTGGGAMLELLEGKELPAIAAMKA